MVNHPSRTDVAAARHAAKAAGYWISEGAYQGTSDDRMGRWYVQHDDNDFIDRRGAGLPTQSEAWLYAAHLAAGGQP